MTYLIAQVLPHLTVYFHPDPGSPLTARGFAANDKATDDIPVHARARKLAESSIKRNFQEER